MIRLAAAILVLVVASPALALPVPGDFIATDSIGDEYPGIFTYDADTGSSVLTQFVGPALFGVTFDWAQPQQWFPDVPDRYPITDVGIVFEPPLLIANVSFLVGAEHDFGQAVLSVRIVPEPSAAAALVLVAAALLMRGYGVQSRCAPASQVRRQLVHFGPDGGA